uniref:Cytochrome P450 n=1 Tax=Plectus sambesii TaxID=2011161 RepID=A0A914WLT5_9BILA
MWFLLLLLSSIALVVWHLNRRRLLFKRLGLPGPEPHWLLGNAQELMQKGGPLQFQEWTKRYGKVYGHFAGGIPAIVTSDLDMLHDVFVKKFDYFHGRRDFPLAGNPDKEKTVNVFNARGLRWKRLRTIGNPTFSVANLKKLMPTVDEHINDLIEKLDAEAAEGRSFDIFKLYQDLTLNVVAQISFGVSKDVLSNPENNYLQLAKKIFGQQKLINNIFTICSVIIPEFTPFWRACAQVSATFRDLPGPQLQKAIKQNVQERRATKATYNGPVDFIQLWLDAEAEPGWQSNQEQMQVSQDARMEMNRLKIERKLSTDEIVAQSFAFLVAGFDTTANSLAYVSYLLATNPDKQTKLYEEIVSSIDDMTNISYEDLMRLKYLDWVVKEGLRLYPLASIVNSRQAMADTTIGDVSVPAGMFVVADTWTIHYSREIWGDDADQFVPERFDPEENRKPQHPMAWIPFGAGPRQCIGMRFALLEEKLALVKIISKFELRTSQETTIPLKLKGNFAATVSPTDVTICVVPRSDY